MNILSILPLDRLANGFHLLGVPWKNVVHALKDTFKSCFVRNKRTLCNFLLEQVRKGQQSADRLMSSDRPRSSDMPRSSDVPRSFCYCTFGYFHKGFMHMRSFVKIKPPRNDEITLSFSDIGKSWYTRKFSKNSDFTVSIALSSIEGLC